MTLTVGQTPRAWVGANVQCTDMICLHQISLGGVITGCIEGRFEGHHDVYVEKYTSHSRKTSPKWKKREREMFIV